MDERQIEEIAATIYLTLNGGGGGTPEHPVWVGLQEKSETWDPDYPVWGKDRYRDIARTILENIRALERQALQR